MQMSFCPDIKKDFGDHVVVGVGGSRAHINAIPPSRGAYPVWGWYVTHGDETSVGNHSSDHKCDRVITNVIV